jgi:hypothetical protein
LDAHFTESVYDQKNGSSLCSSEDEGLEPKKETINNRTVSFSLQALKKRGLVKSSDGKWTLKARSRRVRPLPGGDAHEAVSAG